MPASRQSLVAIVSLIVAIAFLLLKNVLDQAFDESPDIIRFLAFSALCVGVAALVFLLLVPAVRARSHQTNRLSQVAFATGLIALASIIVFFTGVAFVLGAGAFVLGQLGEEQGLAEVEASGEGEANGEDDPGGAGRSGDAADVEDRATAAWAAQVMGILAFGASTVLFVISLIAG